MEVKDLFLPSGERKKKNKILTRKKVFKINRQEIIKECNDILDTYFINMCDEKTDYVSHEEYNFNSFSAKFIITRANDLEDTLNIVFENGEFVTYVS